MELHPDKNIYKSEQEKEANNIKLKRVTAQYQQLKIYFGGSYSDSDITTQSSSASSFYG